MSQQIQRNSDRRGFLASFTPLFLFLCGLCLYLWCMFTHWCMAGHLAHHQMLGVQTDIAWGCAFAASGIHCWLRRYRYVRIVWLLLALLALWSFLWVSVWWLGRWGLLIQASLVVAIVVVLINE